jgi:hypothetical protein
LPPWTLRRWRRWILLSLTLLLLAVAPSLFTGSIKTHFVIE